MNYTFRSLRGFLGLTACLTLSSCASSWVSSWGDRREEVTSIHGAYARKADFVVAYSKGLPGKSRDDKAREVLLATIPRSSLGESHSDYSISAESAGNTVGAKPIPVIGVEDLKKSKVANKEALLIAGTETKPGASYYRCAIQFTNAKGKMVRQQINLPLRGSYLAPAAYPAMAAATVVDVATSPLYVVAGVGYFVKYWITEKMLSR